MAHLHCQKGTRIQTLIRIQNPKGTLCYTEHVHIAQTRTLIPTSYFLYWTGI